MIAEKKLILTSSLCTLEEGKDGGKQHGMQKTKQGKRSDLLAVREGRSLSPSLAHWEEEKMTVQTQMQRAIASAQLVEAQLTQFALETTHQQAKVMFGQLATQQRNILTMLEGRYHQLLQEEPQYSYEKE